LPTLGVRDVAAARVEASVIEWPLVQPLIAASRLRLNQLGKSHRRIRDILLRQEWLG